MEEFLLGCLLPALQKMNVVNQQEIGFAVPSAKLSAGPIENRAYELVHELLSSDVGDPRCRTALKGRMSHSLHQMCFAQPGITVDE